MLPSLLILLGACAHRPAPPPQPALAWLPADTTTVIRSPPDHSLILISLRDLHIPCVAELSDRLREVYQVQRDPLRPMTIIGVGELDRAAFERCALEVGESFGSAWTAERQGDVTVLRAPGQPEHHVQFAGDRVLWAASAEELAAFAPGAPRLAPDAALAPLLTRLAPEGMAIASTSDYTSRLSGVPSTGFVGFLSMPNERGEIRLLFADEGDAAAFRAAVQLAQAAPGAAPAARELLGLLQPTQIGAEIAIDPLRLVEGLRTRPDLAAALYELMGAPAAP